jgi:iron complex outermembrane receptor protein
MTSLTQSIRLALIGSLASVGAVTVAAADTPPVPEGALEDVVVTARLRAESVQEVPVSVTAFSAKALEDAGVKGYGDFVALTPNVSLVEAESVGQSFLTIRGLTQVRNGEAPVAFVVDGVQQTSNRMFSQALFDLDSVQVLKGPQGALYGRNASGGAIVVTTKQPTNEFEGHVQAGGGTGGEYQAQAVVSGPIVKDKLLFRLAGSYTNRDGYFDNVYLHKKADGYDDTTVRGLLKWLVSDAFTAELRLNYSDTNGRALNYHFQSALYDPANPCFADPANPFGGPPPDPNRVDRNFCANNLGLDDRQIREATVKLDYDLGAATLTGIFSYNTVKEFTGGDQFPYTASRNVFGVVDGTQTQFFDIKSRSAEVRLASKSDQPLRWMLGAYFLKTQRFISSTTGSDLGLGIVRLERDPQFASAVNPTLSWFADDNDNRTSAVFGNVAYDVTPALELSAAVRYDKDKRDQTVDPRNTGGVPPGCTAAAPGACVRNASFSKTQPKFTARYKLGADAQVYASWGKGFRSGEYNQYGTGAAAAQVGLVGVTDLVPAETTESAEVGFKSEFLDRRLRINASLFDTTVKGQQYFVFVGQIGAQILVSLDKVDIQGGEFEVVASPVEGLDVYAGVGVSKSKIKRYGLNPADVGNWAPYVPKTSWNAGAQYRFPLTAGLRLMTRLDLVSKGKQYWDPENSAPRDTVNLVNARVALEDAGGRWVLSGGVDNLSDKKYNAEFVLGGFAQPATPRAWTANLRYNF